jgi:hypothetical protein
MNADDPIILYIEDEKRLLRQQFREKKDLVDELYAKTAEVERELNRIKEKLAYTDELLTKRLRDSSKLVGPSLPFLGRFTDMGPTQAVRTLFDTDPDEELSAGQVAELIQKEGFKSTSENLTSIIFTVCKRLEEKDRFLESAVRNNIRYFRKKK